SEAMFQRATRVVPAVGDGTVQVRDGSRAGDNHLLLSHRSMRRYWRSAAPPFHVDRDHLRPRHYDTDDAAVPLLQLGEVQARRLVEHRHGTVIEINAGQLAHVAVVDVLAVRMQAVAAGVAAQVAVEGRADVVKLVEQGDQLILELLIEEARQAKRYQVEHLPTVDDV